MKRLTSRGPNANAPATLPALQALRSASPAEVIKAVEALREWVEVRLGSRGDAYEKAVTLREFEQRLEDVFAKVAELKNFTGDTRTLKTTKLDTLPKELPLGASCQVGEDLFYCNGVKWQKVTLT